jgi:beta-lactamase regulating signal transducer with metallopeptidase domain
MTMLLLALKLTILFAVAALVSIGLRRGRAATRHLVWGLALAGALALPALATVSPRVEVAVLPVETLPSIETPFFDDDAERIKDAGPPLAMTPAVTRQDARAAVTIAWVPLLWCGGAIVVLSLVGMSLLATARLARRTTPVLGGILRDELEQARTALGIRRPVRLLLGHDHAMPMTWGARRPQVLLPAEAVDWPAERRRDVLLHELAHVRRLDWLSQLGGRVVCAAYWWHPLAWYAARRLREERELACDDLVLAQGTNPADYAHHLLAIAKRLRAAPATALASVAMARPSHLAGRLLAVLDGSRERTGITRRSAGAATLTAALVVLPLAGLTAVAPRPTAAPEPTVATAAPEPTIATAVSAPMLAAPTNTLCRWDGAGRSSASHMSSDDDRITIRIGLDDCEVSVRSRGLVRFSDDERDVAELGMDAWFELEERDRLTRRRAEFERRDGQIVRRWYVDGRETTWDAAAQEWFQSTLLVVFRRTSYQAPERARRIHARGGGAALLAEAEQMHTSSGVTAYLNLFAQRERIGSDDARRITRMASQRVSSSSGLSEILTSLLRNPGLDDAVRAEIVQATTVISSSSARAGVLVAASEYRALTPAIADAVLHSASEISSASARGQVLTAVGAQLPANQPLPAAYVQAARGISSSSVQGAVLVSLLERDRLNDAGIAEVLELAGDISSSSERQRVLQAVLAQHQLTEQTREPFFRAVEGIASSSTKGALLRAVMASSPDAATTARVLVVVGTISSSSERTNVLVQAAGAGLINSPALRAAYERAAESIASRSERDRALRALGLRAT